MAPQRGVRIAVEGCGHGTLNAIYASIAKSCEVKGWNGVDLVIIGGDFQAVRNASDLNAMAVPVKYREIGDFHEYYSGQRLAPYPTIFIGGNHEASNHNWELFYGGWVAPNIFYMGAANVVRLGGLRIAGLSGIWKGYDYRKPHFERLPYNQDDIKSIYHVREIDTRRLLQISSQVDIGLSHDWPNGIEWMGDYNQLFRHKPYFREDAQRGQLGSIAAMDVLKWLRPYHWFSAHLHCRYTALMKHEGAHTELSGESTIAGAAKNDDEIDLGLDNDELTRPSTETRDIPVSPVPNVDKSDLGSRANEPGQTQPAPKAETGISEELRAQLPASFARQDPSTLNANIPTDIRNDETRFLALSKCLAGQHFLQLLEVRPQTSVDLPEDSGSLGLEYDAEWLAITRVFADHIQVGDPRAFVPRDAGRGGYHSRIEQERKWVEEHIVQQNRLTIPHNFVATAPAYDEQQGIQSPPPPKEYSSPQTQAFCSLLQICNPFAANEEELQARMEQGPRPSSDRQQRGGFRGGHRGGRSRGGSGSRRGARKPYGHH